jgi:hypothetical protein
MSSPYLDIPLDCVQKQAAPSFDSNHGPFATKSINNLLPQSITATSRSNRKTPSAPKRINVIVDQYSSLGLAPYPKASERQSHESSPCDDEHTHPDMPLSPPPYMPSLSKLFNAHRRDSTHVVPWSRPAIWSCTTSWSVAQPHESLKGESIGQCRQHYPYKSLFYASPALDMYEWSSIKLALTWQPFLCNPG